MKKCWALFLVLVLIFSAGTVASAYDGPPLTQGIDLSQENGSAMNWTLVSYDGRGQFAILCGYDGGIDSCFAANYQGAKAAGVAVGAYCRLSGNTEEAVQTEMVDFITNVLADKQFEYPVYVAVDNQDVYGAVGRQTTTDLAETACEMLTASGYFAGVYTNVSFANNYIDMNRLTGYTTWICQPEGEEQYTGEYDMEQYKLNGRIAGVKPIHLNYCYLDFPSVIKKEGLNGYPPPPPPPDTNTDAEFGVHATKPMTKGYKGDVNVDGKIDARDALIALKICVTKYPYTPQEHDGADVDHNAIVEAKDALEILKYAVKKETVLTRDLTEISYDEGTLACWYVLQDDLFEKERVWLCQTYEEYQTFMGLGYVNETEQHTGWNKEATIPDFDETFFKTNSLVLWYRPCGWSTGGVSYTGAKVHKDRVYLDFHSYSTDALHEKNAMDRIYGFWFPKGEQSCTTVIMRKNFIGDMYNDFGLIQFDIPG